jgi:hypothetical protein
MTRDDMIEVLRQAYRELESECSPTADDLGEVIFDLADDWGIRLEMRTPPDVTP